MTTHASTPFKQRLVQVWSWITEPAPSVQEPEHRRQARLLASFLVLFSMLAFWVFGVPSFFNPAVPPLRNPDVYVALGATAILLLAYALNRAGRYTLAATLTVGAFSAGTTVTAVAALSGAMPSYAPTDVNVLIYQVVPVLFASLLLPAWITALVVAVNGVVMLLLPLFFPQVTLAILLSGPLGFFLAVSALILLTAHHRNQLEKDRRAELAEKEMRYRSLSETTFDGIMISEEGRVVEANTGFARMFGYTLSEVIGMSWLEFIDEEAGDLVARCIEAGDEQSHQTRGVRKDGTRFHIDLVAKSLTHRGRAVHVVAIRDVTERVRAEEEREALIAELEARNAELEQFTYTVSHDLRSPLITIRGFVGMLEQDAAALDHERMKNDMAHISSATEKMHRLLNELLELSRIGRLANPSEEVSLGDLAREAVSMVGGRLAERNVQVDIADDLPTVYGDPNASKFMGDQPDPHIWIGARHDGEETVFYVRDNGMGIDPRYHERVFDLFEKLDARSGGTGIGLTIVKRIVEVHGGRIWVESEGVGCGSKFCFTLPDSRALAEGEAEAPPGWVGALSGSALNPR